MTTTPRQVHAYPLAASGPACRCGMPGIGRRIAAAAAVGSVVTVLAAIIWVMVSWGTASGADKAGGATPAVAAIPDAILTGVYPCYDDAALHAVFFISAEEGWAVGDDGVIWHSLDGGQSWERQKSGTRAALRGVHFLTPYTGWAVGRRDEPGLGPVGVLLYTEDGGWHWEERGACLLPPLHGVRFFDARHGIVWGEGSRAVPSGILITADGGRTWQPLAGPAGGFCQIAFATDARRGIAVGAAARWGTVDLTDWPAGRFREKDSDPASGRTWRAVAWGGTAHSPIVIAGDGGAILVSTDGGDHWQTVRLPLSSETQACCDFYAAAACGRHLWVAGRAGRRLWHSPDRGQTWQAQNLELPLPIYGMFFLTDQLGWLVGAGGVIYRTADGGVSWKVQQLGGSRAAMLCVSGTPRRLPLESVCVWGKAEGYRCVATVVGNEAGPTLAAAERLTQAWRDCGGWLAEPEWAFPLGPHLQELSPRELLAAWDRRHAAQAGQHLLRRMVLAIRTWQPDVVVAGAADPAADAVDRLTLRAAHDALVQAADPQSFPEQLSELGLQPWGAKKLYTLAPSSPHPSAVPAAGPLPDDPSPAQPSVLRTDIERFHPLLANPPQDHAAWAAALLAADPAPARNAFLLAAHRLPGAEQHRDLWEGIDLTAGGAARRRIEPAPLDPAALEQRRRLATSRQRLAQLAALVARSGSEAVQTQRELEREWLRLPPWEAAWTGLHLAAACERAGQWAAARDLYIELLARFPQHPAAVSACRWLLTHEVGAETHALLRSRPNPPSPSGVRPVAGQLPVTGQLPVAGLLAPAAPADFLELEPPRRRWQKALELEPRLVALGPLHLHDPAAHLSLLALRRHLEQRDEALKLLRHVLPPAQTEAALADPWHAAVAAEWWLLDRSRFPRPPKPFGLAVRAETRPLLDGRLDDACWQATPPLPLRPTLWDDPRQADAYASEFRCCWDEQYLYLAVHCRHPDGQQVPPVTPRRRDADLRGHDRVEVRLDCDRDYQTSYRLAVDHRGCLADTCCGQRAWNPRYYVGFASDAAGWTAEWAIPLSELGLQRLGTGQVWAVHVCRIVPGRGVLSWSDPPEAAPALEHAGLLRFTTIAETP